MNGINELIKEYELPKSKATSPRASVVEEFVDIINKERIGTKYEPVTGKTIALMTSHLSLQDLFWFLSSCKDYKKRSGSFSKYFFGALK